MTPMRLYTLSEIIELNPPGFRQYLPAPKRFGTARPPITDRSEFTEHDVAVFAAIADEIRKANPTHLSLKAWAIGSRVSGTWRTKEESEALAAEGYRLKYSDYDVATNARVLPSREALEAAMQPFGEKAHVIRRSPKPLREDAVALSVGSWWSRFASALLAWPRLCFRGSTKHHRTK